MPMMITRELEIKFDNESLSNSEALISEEQAISEMATLGIFMPRGDEGELIGDDILDSFIAGREFEAVARIKGGFTAHFRWYHSHFKAERLSRLREAEGFRNAPSTTTNTQG